MAHNHGEIDQVTGISTTGHEWDGLKELNTPLPRWWLWLFYITIVWSIGYWVFYPTWPTASGYTTGILNHSNRQDALDAVAAGKQAQLAKGTLLADASPADIAKNPELFEYAEALGKSAFANNCSPCHGYAGTGAKGYPNLTADRWIWGGSYDAILKTITVGVRSTDKDTRGDPMGMPVWGQNGNTSGNPLTDKQIVDVVAYVRSLSGLPAEKGGDVAAGTKIFADNCVPCHGEAGVGNPDVGAPKLATKVWLYGGDTDTLIETVTYGRHGVMPTWGGKLDPITIKALAVYVHNLGGGT